MDSLVPLDSRMAWLRRFRDAVKSHHPELAALASDEIGKPGFEALVAEVAAGEHGDAPVGDPGPAAHGEIDAMCSAGLSPSLDAALMADLRDFYEDEGR